MQALLSESTVRPKQFAPASAVTGSTAWKHKVADARYVAGGKGFNAVPVQATNDVYSVAQSDRLSEGVLHCRAWTLVVKSLYMCSS